MFRDLIAIERFDDYYDAIAFANTSYTMLDESYDKKSLKVVIRYCSFISEWMVEIYGRKVVK